MKKYLNILSLLLLLIGLGLKGYAQDQLPTACAGSIERYRVVGDNGNSDFYWEVTGGTIYRYYNDSIDIQWGTAAGVRKITVTETNYTGCQGEPWSQNLMVTSPSVDIGLDYEMCSGQTYEFIAAGSDITSYLWQDDKTTTETFIASSAGKYWVKVTDAYGCTAADTAEVIVHNAPFVDLGPDTTLCGTDGSITFDASEFGIYYSWSDGTVESIAPTYTAYTQTQDQKIWVNVTDQYGCIGSDTVEVRFCGEFEIPNAFTPNDDGSNDRWEIEQLFSFPDVTVDVYNRWGERVFSSKGYPEPWNGLDSKGKKLPMDSYYYVIDLHNGEEAKVGTVTIIR